MTFTSGRLKPEIVLFAERSWMPLITGVVTTLSVPIWSSFAQVNAYTTSSPWETRLVTFNCKESYQVRPNGAHKGAKPVEYWGYGLNDWATVELVGKPGYGSLFWNRPAAVELMGARRIARSAALLRSRPFARSICGVSAL